MLARKFASVVAITAVCIGSLAQLSSAQEVERTPAEISSPPLIPAKGSELEGPDLGAGAPAGGAATGADEVTMLKAQIADLKVQLNAIQRLLENQETDLRRVVEDELGNVQVRLNNLEDRFNDIAQADGDRFVPSILGNMQSSRVFRQELMRANQGVLIVDNQTGANQTLYINGQPNTVPSGRFEFDLPLGRFSTQLYPYENRKDWDMDHWTYDEKGRRFEHKLTIGY